MSDQYDWAKGEDAEWRTFFDFAYRVGATTKNLTEKYCTQKTVCSECYTEMYPGGTCDTCGCAEQVTLYFTPDGKPIECKNDVPRVEIIEGELPRFEL